MAHQKLPPERFGVIAAYVGTLIGLMLLRGSAGVFMDVKEITFAGPLMAVCAAFAIETLAEGGRRDRMLAWLCAIALVVFDLSSYARYLEPAILSLQ